MTMSDAPERIWANVHHYTNGRWVDYNSTIPFPVPETLYQYVRADLYEELEAEVKTLRSLHSAVLAGRVSLTKADIVGTKTLKWWGPPEQADE